MTIHVTRKRLGGIRFLFKRCSRRVCKSGKSVLGQVTSGDWCEHPVTGKIVGGGYYWTDLGDGYGKTFYRLRDCVADFEREMKERKAANDKRQKART